MLEWPIFVGDLRVPLGLESGIFREGLAPPPPNPD